LVAAASALALSACGGGEGGGSYGGGGAARIPPTPIPPAPAPGPLPPPPQDVVPTTHAEAARFALQAQFSVSEEDIISIKSGGVLAWLDARYNEEPGETGVAWLDSHGLDVINEEKRYRRRANGDYMIWNQLIAGLDQMRKRIALALSELFVVSERHQLPASLVRHRRLLGCAHCECFRQFPPIRSRRSRSMLAWVFSQFQGQCQGEPAGRQPDENYAREVMQLFTIGLYQLNPDGTHKLDADNSRWTPSARKMSSILPGSSLVMTGTITNGGTTTPVAWEEDPIPSKHFAINPMSFNSYRHSSMEVNFPGTKITGTTPARMPCTSRSTVSSITTTQRRSSYGR
jgi:hypothetical protein